MTGAIPSDGNGGSSGGAGADLYARHGDLASLYFRRGLSEAEAVEWEEVCAALDAMEAEGNAKARAHLLKQVKPEFRDMVAALWPELEAAAGTPLGHRETMSEREVCPKCKGSGSYRHEFGYNMICDCADLLTNMGRGLQHLAPLIDAGREPGTVRIPTTADEAALMVSVGLNWLENHAPERLTPAYRAKLAAPPE